MAEPSRGARLARLFPALVPTGSGLVRDLVAGLTLAAVTVPEQMATARLAGYAPQFGLLAFIAATLGFALFGASRVLTGGADSTITSIFAGSLAALAATGAAGVQQSGAMLALLVGAFVVAASLLRLGWVASLLSTPVLTGFLAGISVHIIVSQLPAVLGVPAGGGALFDQLAGLAGRLGALNPLTLVLGLGVMLVVLVGERWRPRWPWALVAVAAASLLVASLGLEPLGVATLGALPSGLPGPVVPAFGEVLDLLPLALIVALVVLIQTAVVANAFREPGHPAQIDRDYLGIGMGSLLSGLAGAFPVNASPPRTAVAASAGARSQLAALLAALLVLALLLAGGPLLGGIPVAALAGVLLFVALRILRVATMTRVLRAAPVEAWLILVTALAIIVLPIQTGVAIAIGISLLHSVYISASTRAVRLARLPGSTVWWPPAAEVPGERVPGVLVVGFPAPLLFANAEIFRRGVMRLVADEAAPPRLVVLEASGIADVDFTAGAMLVELIGTLRQRGIAVALARLESARAARSVHRLGIAQALGEAAIFHSVEEAVRQLGSRSDAR